MSQRGARELGQPAGTASPVARRRRGAVTGDGTTSHPPPDLAAVVELLTHIGSSLDPDEVARRAVCRAVEISGADQGALLGHDAGGVTVRAASGAAIDGGVISGVTTLLESGADLLIRPQDRDLTGRAHGHRPVPGAGHSVIRPVGPDQAADLLVVLRSGGVGFTPIEVRGVEAVAAVTAVAALNAQEHRRLHAADESKADLLRLSAHELRGPLTMARGYANMLRTGVLGPLPDAVERLIALIETKAGEASELVDQLLETVRLEDGASPPESRIVDMGAVAAAAVDRARADHPGRLVDLEPARDPARVRGDDRRIFTVLRNLLDNALKYSPGGGPVSCRVGASGGQVVVAVVDEGLGIADEDVDRLFTRFGRIETPQTRAISGTGLGLYISRKIARAHGGDVAVRSTPDLGSIFTLTLPGA